MALSQQQIEQMKRDINIQQPTPTSKKSGSMFEQMKLDASKPSTSINQTVENKESLISKIGKGILNFPGEVGEHFVKPGSDLFFGSTIKTVGGLFRGAVESAKEIVTGKEIPNKTGLSVAPEGNKLKTSDAIWTTVELYPGGGILKNAIKETKFGNYFLKAFKDIPEALKEKAVAQFSKVFTGGAKNVSKEVEYLVKDVVPKMLDRGQKIITKSGFINKAGDEARKAGMAIDAVMDTIPDAKKVVMEPIISSAREVANKFTVEGVENLKSAKEISDAVFSNVLSKNPTIANEVAKAGFSKDALVNVIKNKLSKGEVVNGLEELMKKVIAEPDEYKYANELIDIMEQLGDEVSFKSVRNLRQIWDKSLKKSGRYAGKTVEEGSKLSIKSSMTDAIRDELAKAEPRLDKVNKEYNFWKNAEKLTKISKGNKVGLVENALKVMTTYGGIRGIVGGVAKLLSPKNIIPALGVGAIKLFKSPAYRTLSATQKYKLAEYIAKGDFMAARLTISKMLSSINNLVKGENIEQQ
jgi:hypothetical protein